MKVQKIHHQRVSEILDVEIRVPDDLDALIHKFGRDRITRQSDTFFITTSRFKFSLKNSVLHAPAGTLDDLAAQFALYSLVIPFKSAVEASALAMHGSAVRTRDGEAIVFIGPSGVGKSTTARELVKLETATFLSDDVVLLRPRSEGFSVPPGLPYSRSVREEQDDWVLAGLTEGKYAHVVPAESRAKASSLRLIVLLEEGDPEFTRVRNANALLEVAEHSLDYKPGTEALRRSRFRLAHRVTKQVPVYRFRFRKTVSGRPEHVQTLIGHVQDLE